MLVKRIGTIQVTHLCFLFSKLSVTSCSEFKLNILDRGESVKDMKTSESLNGASKKVDEKKDKEE